MSFILLRSLCSIQNQALNTYAKVDGCLLAKAGSGMYDEAGLIGHVKYPN
jgi:hypothetical protein